MKPSILALVAISASLTPIGLSASPIISDPNLLSGQTVTTDSPSHIYNAVSNPLSGVTDGTTGNFLFQQDSGDTDGSTAFEQLLSISLPSNSDLTTIRIWAYPAPDVPPKQVTVYSSSTPTTSFNESDYSLLVSDTNITNLTFTGASVNGGFGYYDLAIAPGSSVATLLFDFGTQNATGANGNLYDYTRIGEIQAFGSAVVVPEPSAYALLGFGLAGLLVILRLRKVSRD